jgi:hypothetical protein
MEDETKKINLRSNFKFYSIKEKLRKFSKIGQHFNLRQGTKPYGIKDQKEIELLSKIQYDDTWERAINGRNISRYHIHFDNDFVKRSDDLHSCLSLAIINEAKIYFQRMRKISLFPRIVASYDNDNIHGLYTCSVIYYKDLDLNLKYALCILNSLLINVWYKYFDTDIEIKLASVKEIPIPKIVELEQLPFIAKADIMLSKNKELQGVKQQLLQFLISKFESITISKKLQDWPSLSFSHFLKELQKQKIKLSLPAQAEWMQYFESEKAKANAIEQLIDKTDKEIDEMVYQLYGLTEEERKVVEEG